ncbi:hypothetical protein CDAR_297391 [Caerostris darwini]|uniref:Uncharacterized protein n=1 Tax=Caerostris darwini TaxID=1538125 RepID=A0AAV4PTE1_9ARAC|nr:hypothetical protein CDAR_297391 [Caerostris darwini]
MFTTSKATGKCPANDLINECFKIFVTTCEDSMAFWDATLYTVLRYANKRELDFSVWSDLQSLFFEIMRIDSAYVLSYRQSTVDSTQKVVIWTVDSTYINSRLPGDNFLFSAWWENSLHSASKCVIFYLSKFRRQ